MSATDAPISTVDAFVIDGPFQGNPAAVMFRGAYGDVDLSDRARLLLAKEMALSETTFVEPLPHGGDADFRIRWFTPAAEVDLCGHATLAAAHALWSEGHAPAGTPIRFMSLSGVLVATPSADGLIELDFPNECSRGDVLAPLGDGASGDREPASEPETIEHICAGLGLPVDRLLQVCRNRMDVLVEVSAEDFAALRVDTTRLGEVAECRVLSVTACAPEGSAYDFQSRSFAPAFGVPEDPVCGSAHCFLGPHWAAKLGKTELRAHAASERGGALRVTVSGDRVRLAGRAATTLQGRIALPRQ